MTNPDHLRILLKGVQHWNQWRKDNPEITPYLFEANLRQAHLNGANLKGAYLPGAKLTEADLDGANLIEANLRGANLIKALLNGADLSGADLDGANLSGADLRGADLSEADLGEVDFRMALLRGADLSRARLFFAKFRNADLRGASLSGADLRGADLRWVDLSEADLTKANLHQAHLSDANLRGANLEYAYINGTTFANLDFSQTKGLDKLKPGGPSIVDHRTLINSKNIDQMVLKKFLRVCGFLEHFIDYVPDLLRSLDPIKFPSCFISHSSEDNKIAEMLFDDLQEKGMRCYYAPEKMETGDFVRDEIKRAIWDYDKLLLLISKDSVHSRWVRTEVETALAKEDKLNKQLREKLEAQGKFNRENYKKIKVLFPIRLDDQGWNTFEALIEDIRLERHICDFSGWKDQEVYANQLQTLLKHFGDAGPQITPT